MSSRKWKSATSAFSQALKKRMVSSSTVEKWIRDNDKEFNTATWLKYEKDDADNVMSLMCSLCTYFEAKPRPRQNFNPSFIKGTHNLRSSSFKDHAHSDMHVHTTMLFHQKHHREVTDYSPIARALHSLDPSREQTKKKFDIAYLIAKEKLAFRKMGALCDLEQRHGVDSGEGYKNNQACASFVDCISTEQL